MSSKRKSPPTKLSEGGGGTGTVAGANEEEEDTTSSVTGGPGGEIAVGEEGRATPVDIEECYPHQRGGDCESSGCSSPATTSEPDLRDSPSPSSNSLQSKRQRIRLTCKMNSESLSLQDDTSNNRRNSPPPSSTPTGHNAHWIDVVLKESHRVSTMFVCSITRALLFCNHSLLRYSAMGFQTKSDNTGIIRRPQLPAYRESLKPWKETDTALQSTRLTISLFSIVRYQELR
ncbi:unnamed protein product, partial [Heterotrigona itama]